MKSGKRRPEMNRMQVFSMSAKMMTLGLYQQIDAARDKTWARRRDTLDRPR